MYHRYLPTANGQYRRLTVPDRKPAPEKREVVPLGRTPEPPPEPISEPPQEPVLEMPAAPILEAPPVPILETPPEPVMETPPESTSETPPIPGQPPEPPGRSEKARQGRGRQTERPFSAPERLLAGMDSGDLLLLLVLILLLSEGREDSSPTILTLALSLFLS